MAESSAIRVACIFPVEVYKELILTIMVIKHVENKLAHLVETATNDHIAANLYYRVRRTQLSPESLAPNLVEDEMVRV